MKHLTMEQISSHVDERLPDQDRRVLMDHVKGCTACRSEIQRITALRQLIKDLPVIAIDPWFADQMENLAMGEEGVDRLWLGPERVAAHAVMGLAVIVAGLLIGLLLQTEAPLTVSERNMALGSTDTSTQLLMSFSELSKDDLLMSTMTGE